MEKKLEVKGEEVVWLQARGSSCGFGSVQYLDRGRGYIGLYLC